MHEMKNNLILKGTALLQHLSEFVIFCKLQRTNMNNRKIYGTVIISWIYFANNLSFCLNVII